MCNIFLFNINEIYEHVALIERLY